MSLSKHNKTMASIGIICSRTNGRLTAKKREIFEILLREKKALSVYEIADTLKKKNPKSTPVMSIYRALDFFKERGVVHRISSLNRYSACLHISCEHKHEMPRLAICLNSHKVDELASNSLVKNSLEKGLNAIEFELQSQQLEVLGLCIKCNKKKRSPKI